MTRTGTNSRACPRCGKPLSKERAANRKKYCYRCERAVKREQRLAAHDRRVEKQYGLLPGEYRKLYDAQGGKCAIRGCRATGKTKALAVEHDHSLGFTREAVRGLTCGMHNGWIGLAGDNPEVFDSMANYLRNPPARKVLT